MALYQFSVPDDAHQGDITHCNDQFIGLWNSSFANIKVSQLLNMNCLDVVFDFER